MSLQNHEQVVVQAMSNRYQNADKTKLDVMTALHNYRGLSPKLDKFVFRSGNSRFLLCLEGTIPVTYKGSTYNIPVCIWLLDNHPFSPPMVYVKPTNDMLIKASRHVDQNGKVFLPYLHEWNLNSSDLVGLIQIMIMVFNEMPPVYAKPKNHPPNPTATPYPTPYPTNPPGYMPMPGVGGGNLPYPSSQPPPPTATTGYPPPYPNTGAGYPPTSTTTPYPVYPPTHNTATPPSSYPPPYSTGITYPPYPTTTASPGTQTSTTESTSNTGTITEEHIRASLISAVSDRAKAKLRDSYGGAQAEVSVLRQQQTDLTQGKIKLEGLISKLDHEQTELDKNVRVLREKESEMVALVSRLTSATQPLDVDEAVTTTAPLYKQVLNSYAEDQATQDAIYYLGEALKREVVDLDTYLRHVRSLSRTQFQLRATMIKCRIKGNMAG